MPLATSVALPLLEQRPRYWGVLHVGDDGT